MKEYFKSYDRPKEEDKYNSSIYHRDKNGNLYAHLDTSSVTNTGKVITNVFGTKKEVATTI